MLPAWLARQQDGVFVDLSLFPVGGGFAEFLDHLFAAGQRFVDLDYVLLTGLLYDFDTVLDRQGIGAKVRLAGDIVAFPPVRRALYKAVKIDPQFEHAEYVFEPARIEVVSDEPVYGEAGADGTATIIGSARKSEMRPTRLDIDEFIAEMWTKGVRFGIAVDAVARVIASGETVRMEIARQLAATAGSDAEVEEASDALRRDNSPKRLANGQADLRKFQNRFPQIAKGARLLKKKKRVLGKHGFRVDGTPIEPPLPQDFDMQALAGEGTRVESQGANEFIVATRDGFLSLELDTNHIAVTEKIENKSGVSAKTTGDLSLAGNEFIEHGEVQEGRIVEGKNMTFRSDVYGEIVSHGGQIRLDANLSSGSATSLGGDITSNGRALNSVLEAWDGHVKAKYAEGCLILGNVVEVERAVNCEIAALEVHVGMAEGCGIAGKVVRIDSSRDCRDHETIVSILVPALLAVDSQIRLIRKAMDECRLAIEARDQELARIKSDDEVAKYLALEASIHQGVVRLNPVQQASWQKMVSRFARVGGTIASLEAAKQEQARRKESLAHELDYLLAARKKSGEGRRCEIGEIAGDTLVRTMAAHNDIAEFRQAEASALRIRMREQGLPQERVFAGGEGSFAWIFELPDVAAAAESPVGAD